MKVKKPPGHFTDNFIALWPDVCLQYTCPGSGQSNCSTIER